MTLLLAVLFVFWGLAAQTLPAWHWVIRPGFLIVACLMTWILYRAGLLT